jgi:hypothetical protein
MMAGAARFAARGPAVLAAGIAVFGAAPVAAGAAEAGVPGCTVTWSGAGANNSWDNPANWSTGRVPGSASDVCVWAFVFVSATGAISVHSLQIGEESTIDVGGTGPQVRSRLSVATTLVNQGNLGVFGSTVHSPVIDNTNGIESDRTSTITSAGLSNRGTVAVIDGRLTVPDAPAQLSGGTLSGGTWDATSAGTLVLPGPVSDLAAGQIMVSGPQSILAGGHNALAGLATIGGGATLAVAGGTLPISGSLSSRGTVQLGGYQATGALTVAGSYTQQRGASAGLNGQLQATTISIGAGSGLQGTGTLAGDVMNDGSVLAGGPLKVTGNYTQAPAATLQAGQANTTATLAVTGHAALSGTLHVYVFLPPTPGTRSTAVTFGSRSGNFTSHTIGFRLDTTSTQIQVVATPQIAVTPATAAPGAPVTVNGGDFAYESTVGLHLDTATGTPVQTAVTDRGGFFQTQLVLPKATPAGPHTLIAVGTGGRKATAILHVS